MTTLDLSQIPAPDIVETLDYEAILAEMLVDLQARDPLFTALVESDPAYKILEVAAYREVVLRARINNATQACMLAYSTNTDLDNLAALLGTTRFVIDEGDPNAIPPIPPSYETDTELRTRTQLAFEGLSVAGPRGAYEYHALSADSDILDIDVFSPSPGVVDVTVLSRTGDGTPAQPILDTVDTVLNSETIRPLTDLVNVAAPTIINYNITASLSIYTGPDQALVLQAAIDAVNTYVIEHHKLGHDITISGLHAQLHQAGVHNVNLTAPAADIIVAHNEAAYCTGIDITIAGTGE